MPVNPSGFDADVIVVGLGAMGAAVTYQAQSMGLEVLGIDRHEPPHEFGSSHAETRISRLAVGEGPQYIPFVARAHELWHTIGDAVGETLFHQSGGYVITNTDGGNDDRWHDFVTATDNVAQLAGIPYTTLTAAEVRAAHPNLKLTNDMRAGHEPTGGVIMCERAVEAQLRLARQNGARIRVNETVAAVTPDDQGVVVETDQGSYRARDVVLATGAWMHDLASAHHSNQLSITRQAVFWFEAEDLDAFRVDRMPFVIWTGDTIDDYVGLFPVPPGATNGVKILGEQFSETTSPSEVNRTISDAEVAEFYETHVAPQIDGVTSRCIKRAVCLYTNTLDDHFLIEPDPRSNRITVMSPCSGHGFKHSPALGEAVAQRIATGASDLDLSPFGWGDTPA